MKRIHPYITLLIALSAALLTGCASTRALNPVDPFEPMNRGIYQFNDTVDKAITKPLAKGYKAVMPETGRTMVTNFFSNLDDVVVTANDLLQFKFVQGFSDAMRILVNSTVGVGGLIDVASMRLEKHNEDFGQTLGYWGVETGPYLVIPILGPSTLRDTVGDIGDSQISMLPRIRHVRTRNQAYVTKAVNRRAQLLEQENILDDAIIDRYQFIRDAYLQRRLSRVYDGNPPHASYEDEESDFKYQPDSTVPAEPTVPAVPSVPETPVKPVKPLSSNTPAPIADAQVYDIRLAQEN